MSANKYAPAPSHFSNTLIRMSAINDSTLSMGDDASSLGMCFCCGVQIEMEYTMPREFFRNQVD